MRRWAYVIPHRSFRSAGLIVCDAGSDAQRTAGVIHSRVREVGGDDRHTQFIAKVILDRGPKDNVGVRISHGGDGLSDSVHVLQSHRRPTCHAEDYASRTLHGKLEERRRDGCHGGVLCARPAEAAPHAHEREPRATHDRPHVRKVDIDEPRLSDEVRQPDDALAEYLRRRRVPGVVEMVAPDKQAIAGTHADDRACRTGCRPRMPSVQWRWT